MTTAAFPASVARDHRVPGDPLAPVRAALLDRARGEADRLLALADDEAAAVLGEARARARRIRDEASADAAEYTAALAAQQRTRDRRQARATVLGACRAAYDELSRRSREVALRMRDVPGYPMRLERLTARARAELGAGAVVREHPDGGVVAEASGRHLCLTLPALADRAVADLGAAAEGLWQP